MRLRKLYRTVAVPLAAAAMMATAAVATTAVATAAGGGAGGVTGPAIFVDGTLFRTVGTPTDLSNTGAPDHAFDVIYDFGGLQHNVATAAPGDQDFNGGRWKVHALSFGAGAYMAALADGDVDVNGNDVLDSDAEVLAAIDEGYAMDAGVVKTFECPLNPVPRSAQGS